MISYGTSEGMHWIGGPDEVRFMVEVDGKRIFCRVSQECIEDHCGSPRSPEACLEAARSHFDAITDRIGSLIARERFEPNGSVLLGTLDW